MNHFRFDASGPDNCIQPYPVLVPVMAGDWVLSKGGVMVQMKHDSDILHAQVIPLIKPELEFPKSLMSVPCRGIVMQADTRWFVCKTKPKITAGQWEGRLSWLDGNIFSDLPVLHKALWKESWIPKPKE